MAEYGQQVFAVSLLLIVWLIVMTGQNPPPAASTRPAAPIAHFNEKLDTVVREPIDDSRPRNVPPRVDDVRLETRPEVPVQPKVNEQLASPLEGQLAGFTSGLDALEAELNQLIANVAKRSQGRAYRRRPAALDAAKSNHPTKQCLPAPILEEYSTPENARYAYVTYVSSGEFVPAAAVLLHSIAATNSTFARVVCVTKGVTQRDRRLLAVLAQVVEVETVPHTHVIHDDRYKEVFNKLRLWQLISYKKIVYFDSDVLVLRNCDELFDLPEWSVPMDANQDRYSTGMMIIEPRLATYDDMLVKLAETKVDMGLPDLLFLTEYFTKAEMSMTEKAAQKNFPENTLKLTSHKINIIPRWFQVYQEEFAEGHKSYMVDYTASVSVFDSRVHGIHYPGPLKPWQNMKERQKKYQGAFCQWASAWQYSHDPNFLWHLHYMWTMSTLNKMHDLFDVDVAPVVVLKTLVKAAEDEQIAPVPTAFPLATEHLVEEPHEVAHATMEVQVLLPKGSKLSSEGRAILSVALAHDLENVLGLPVGSLWVESHTISRSTLKAIVGVDEASMATGRLDPFKSGGSVAVKLTATLKALEAKEDTAQVTIDLPTLVKANGGTKPATPSSSSPQVANRPQPGVSVPIPVANKNGDFNDPEEVFDKPA